MIEIVFNSNNYQELFNEAQRLGFVEEDGDRNLRIKTQGLLPGGGSYFLNIVGEITEKIYKDKINGYWGRLRLNGDDNLLPYFSEKITQYLFSYEKIAWIRLDSGEKAPDYVEYIGCIM